MPLHADGVHVGMTEASLVANCNYALTPYNKENGALTIVPGSHRKNRQPTPNENWMHGDATVADVVGQQLPAEELDQLESTLVACINERQKMDAQKKYNRSGLEVDFVRTKPNRKVEMKI